MGSIKPFLDKMNCDKADKVIKKANNILHSKRTKVTIAEEETYDAIKDTFAIIEALFSGNNRKVGRR